VVGSASSPATVFGSSGSNVQFFGQANNNVLVAGSGNETLSAANSTGSTQIWGGSGNDALQGGGANDTIVGGSGNATMTGGAGNDMFAFFNGSAGNTTITDFTVGQDQLSLVGYSPLAVQISLGAQENSGGSTQLTLSDNTKITLVGVGHLDASSVIS
jgi:Ca2+-binding RTX toxin-like protein